MLTAMCGRFTHHLNYRQIVELYGLMRLDKAPNHQPHSDICLTTDMLIARDQEGEREAAMARWARRHLEIDSYRSASMAYTVYS